MASLWLGLSVLLAGSRGNVEASLRTAFARYSRADAFENLNGVLFLFWAAHSSLFLMATAAARLGRPDVLKVLVIGPIIAGLIGVLGQNWADPNWFVVVAVCTIGWLVGSAVSGLYWLSRPGSRRA